MQKLIKFKMPRIMDVEFVYTSAHNSFVDVFFR
jgi:hypothetical protein